MISANSGEEQARQGEPLTQSLSLGSRMEQPRLHARLQIDLPCSENEAGLGTHSSVPKLLVGVWQRSEISVDGTSCCFSDKETQQRKPFSVYPASPYPYCKHDETTAFFAAFRSLGLSDESLHDPILASCGLGQAASTDDRNEIPVRNDEEHYKQAKERIYESASRRT